MNITKYIINHSTLDQKRLLDPWKWMIGEDKEIVVVTKIGDVVLKDPSNKLYLLSITDGSIELLSNYSSDFFKNKLSPEQYYEIFQPKFIEDLEDSEQGNKQLMEGEIYAYTILPVLGGSYILENIYCADIYTQFNLTGRTHKEIDELPRTESV